MRKIFTLAAGVSLTASAFAAQLPIPANPTVDSYSRRGYMYELKVIVPTIDIKGNGLNTDNLYYRFYINGEPFTFTTDTYRYIESEMTLIPWDYQDQDGYGYDIMKWYGDDNMRRIYLYSAPSEIGIESVYITTQGESVSARYTYDTATGTGYVGENPDPGETETMITELPATAYTNLYTLDTWMMGGSGMQHSTWSGKFDHLGFNGNDVYLKDICGEYRFNTYVKGTLNDDKTTLRLPMGQLVFHQDEDLDNGLEEADVYLRACKKDEATQSVILLPEVEYVDFNMDANGVISLSADQGVAYVGHDGHLLAKNLGYVYEPFNTYTATVYPPANAKPVNYKLTYCSEPDDKRNVRQDLKVIIDESTNNVFIQGLAKNMPEAWIKGAITGETASFPSEQYIGTYTQESTGDQFAVYLNGAIATDQWGVFGREYATKDYLTFSYDKETGIFRSDDSVTETIGTVNPLGHIVAPELQPAEVKEFEPIAPADPTIKSWSPRGFVYELMVDVPSIDVNGELLDTDGLVYRFYINGETEPMAFNKGTYNYIETDMTDIPWGYQDQDGYGYDIMKWNGEDSRRIYFYEKPSTITIESTYTVKGIPTNSRRYCFDVATRTGAFEQPTAVDIISNDNDIIERIILGLDGKVVTNPTNGIYIVTTKYADGTSKTEKRVMR